MKWLNNIKLSLKMTIIGILALTAIALPTQFFINTELALVSTTKTEQLGLAPIQELIALEKIIQQHRGMSAIYLGGNRNVGPQLDTKAQEVKAELSIVISMFNMLMPNNEILTNLENVEREFKQVSLAVRSNQISGADSFTRQTEMVYEILNEAIPHVAEYFGLSYDPDATTYHLIIGATHDLPRLLEGMGAVRGLGAGALAAGAKTIDQIAAIKSAFAYTVDAYGALLHNYETSVEGTDIQSIHELFKALENFQSDFESFSGVVENEIMKKDVLTYPSETFFKNATKLIDNYFILSDKSFDVLDQSLQQRVDEAENFMFQALLLIGSLILGGLGLAILIVRSVVKGVTDSATVANKISTGDFVKLESNGRKDEIGQLINSLGEMSSKLETAAVESKANFALKQAIDNSGTALMMCDDLHVISYVNQAAIDLLKPSVSAIKNFNDDFSLTKMVTTSFLSLIEPQSTDAVKRKINNLTETVDALIHIEDRIFQLTLNPVVDEEGNRTGSFIEWVEMTEQIKAEAERTRILESLDCTSTNIMIADANRDIIYLNASVKKMLSNCEKDLQAVLPHFDVKTVLGSNMDIFHKNPAHQEKLLEQLKEKFVSQIKVGRLHIRLISTPIFGQDGTRLGSVVEWLDRTSEVEAEQEIGQLVSAASQGDFTGRAQLDNKEGFMRTMAEALNQLIETSETGLNDIARVLLALSEGDLTQKITADYAGTFDLLKTYSNQTTSSLASMIGDIRIAADTINTASSEIAQGNADLSNRTDQQAASLEETASSMEQLTSTVRLNADNAKEANNLASQASGVAVDGGALIQEVVKTMESINESSQKISDIIGVIDGIAFQTNILALNAAVEAARAGEQGRGFAVVASEVRTLAQRSANAAKDIKSLISDSVNKISDGNRLVGKSGDTMGEIVTAIKKVNDIMSEIAAASAEQASGIDEIGRAVSQMDEMTQQNAALVEEAAASAESMQSQADQMANQVASFKLDEFQDAPAQIVHQKPVAKALPVHNSSRTQNSKVEAPKVEKKIVQSKDEMNNLRSQMLDSDDWEEF